MQYRIYNPPNLHQSVINRPEAIAKLKDAISHPLSLLWAPAGYGKSTLASLFLQTYQCNRIWYPLTAFDNDDSTFCSLLLTGLVECNPNNGELSQALKRINQLTPKQQLELFCDKVQQIYGASNQLLILVLDDFHLIKEQSCLEIIQFLSEQLPIFCRILISTREKPALDIEKMKASGELSVLEPQDLLFSYSETQQFLETHCDKNLPDNTCNAFYSKTSGWPVALQLLTATNHHLESPDSVKDLTVSEQLQDYFDEQIVAKFSDAEFKLLTQMATFKEFCLELAALFSETAKSFIQDLVSRRLVSVVRREAEVWYKLHDLVREYLWDANALSKDELTMVADWFHERDDKDNAIELYLQAQNYSAALPLIVELCEDHMLYGNHQQFQKLIKRIPQAYLEQDPCALAFYAWHLDDHDKESVGMPLLEKAESLIKPKLETLDAGAEKERLIQVLIYVYCFRSFIYRFNNRIDQAVIWLEQAFQLAQGRVVKGLARIYAGKMQIAFAFGSMSIAEDFGKQSIAHAKSEMDLTTLPIAVGFLVNVYCVQGRLNEAIAYSRGIKEWAKNNGVASFPMITAIDSSLMEVNREMNQISDCFNGLKIGEEYCREGAQESHKIAFEFAKVSLYLSLGMFEKLEESFNFLEAMLPKAVGQSQNLTFSFPSIEALRLATAFLSGGEIDVSTLITKGESLLNNELFILEKEKLLVGRLLAANNELDLSSKLTAEAIKTATKNDHLQNVIYGELNEVLIHWQRGDKILLKTAFEKTLKNGLAHGFVRPFVDLQRWSEPLYNWSKDQIGLVPLFEKLDANNPVVKHDNVQPLKSHIELLSNRENTVLKLVSEGKSNKEIARELHISVHTVKTFTGHIFRKLEVRNRTQASLMYRESSQLN